MKGSYMMITKKGKKHLFLFIVAVLMLSLLSACASNNANGNDNKPANHGSNSTTQGEGGSDKGGVTELSLFIDASWYPVNEWKGPIAEKITEKTGVKLKVTVAADDKQLPLMISSGDLPDLVFTHSQIDRLS